MNTFHNLRRFSAVAVLSAGVAVGSSSLANAQPAPAPLNHWPGCTEEHPQGPCNWCPGQQLPPTGNHVTNPVRWNESVCHTYYYVNFGTGNVASNIWDGPNPPALAGH